MAGNILTYSVSGLTAITAYTFRVEASAAAGNSSSDELSLETKTKAIPEPNRAPVFNTICSQKIDEGKTLQFTIVEIGPDGDVLTYSATSLPKGAVFNKDTKVFSWTPGFDQSGTYILKFEVSDGTVIDRENVTLTVNNVTATKLTLGLIIKVKALDLKKGIKDSLLTELISVISYLNRNKYTDASSKIQAFISEVKAQKGKQLSESQANSLITAAEQIQAVIKLDDVRCKNK